MLNGSISSAVAYGQFLSPRQFAEYFRRICVSFTKFMFLFGECKESQAIVFGFAYEFCSSDISYRTYSRKNELSINDMTFRTSGQAQCPMSRVCI